MTDDWWNIKILWPECRCLCTGYDFSDIQERFQCALHGNSVLDFGCGSGRDTKKFTPSKSDFMMIAIYTEMEYICGGCNLWRRIFLQENQTFYDKTESENG